MQRILEIAEIVQGSFEIAEIYQFWRNYGETF